MDVLPFKQNINWTQLVGIIGTILVLLTGGKVNLDLATQAAIVAGIQGIVALITWVQHTFINHPANQAKAAAMVSNAVGAIKNTNGALLVLALLGVLMLPMLTACAAVPQDPRTILTETETAFSLAEATYDSICSINNPPSFCTDPGSVAAYAEAKTAIEAAFQTAEAGLSASNGQVNIAQLIAAVQADWQAYNSIVNDTKAKALRAGISVR